MALLAGACSSAGAYGYSRTYAPLEGEDAAVADAREYDPVMADRQAEEWKRGSVQLFGVVSKRSPAPGGLTLLEVSLRRPEARNLCADESSSSCRMTVTAKSFGQLRLLAKLAPEDDTGATKIEAGSLLRIVGKLAQTPGADKALVRVSWYRHWPGDQYVTTAAREHMRR